jgi:hypothetical protein
MAVFDNPVMDTGQTLKRLMTDAMDLHIIVMILKIFVCKKIL